MWGKSFWKKERKITNRSVLLFLVIVFLLAGISSGIFINLVFPWLADVPGLRLLTPRFTVVVNKTEEVVVNEGVKVNEIYGRIRAATVTLVSQDSAEFSLSQAPKRFSNGVVVASDGLIFTTKTAVGDLSGSLYVFLDDGRVFPGEVLAFDPKSELAVVKIAATDLPVVNFGFASELSAGDKLVAVGGSLDRFVKPAFLVDFLKPPAVAAEFPRIRSSEKVDEFLEVSGDVNRLGEGAVLANREAVVVGLVSAKGILTGEYLRTSLDNFLSHKELLRPDFGISYLPVTPPLSQLLQLPREYGVLVRQSGSAPAVKAGSPAQAAGLREGDFIFRINGTEISAENTFEKLFYSLLPGEKVDIGYFRDNQEHAITVTLTRLR